MKLQLVISYPLADERGCLSKSCWKYFRGVVASLPWHTLCVKCCPVRPSGQQGSHAGGQLCTPVFLYGLFTENPAVCVWLFVYGI